MPETNPPQSTSTAAAPPSSPPPSGPATPTAAEFRFANDASVPEYARGKSAAEILGLTQKLVERFSQVPERPAPPPQTPTYTLDPEGYVTGGQVTQAFGQLVQPEIQSAHDLAASAVYAFTQSKFPKEFSKYGPEITQRLAGVPKKLWTLDNLETVVKLVRADHFADYQAEWQTESAAKMEQTIRSSGVGGSAPVQQPNKEHSLESEKIPDEWKLRAQRAGLTESTVQEFCRLNDMTAEQFYKQFDTPRNAIVAEVPSGR